MKMKTQIKRKAKRTLSLFLTAMLLISTMVVGISTVSAATERTVYFVNRDGWSTVNAHCWYNDGSKDVSEKAWPGKEMTEAGTYNEKKLYKYTLDTKYTHIIFNNGSDKQTGDLKIPSDKNLYDSTITDNNGWTQYSELGSVATSVSLTPTTQDINAGDSATLTASLTGKNSELGEVTFQLISNGSVVDEKASSELSVTFTVNPENTTTYTVMASATNYNSIVSNEVTVKVVVPKTFYLWRSNQNNINYTSGWDAPVPMKVNSEGKYTCDINVTKDNNYVTITEDTVNPYNSLAWSSENEVKSYVTETSSIISSVYVQNYNGNNNKQYFFPIFISSKEGKVTFTFDGDKALVASDPGSTTETVTITVPTVDNATVTAVANSTTYNEGKSFEIEVGSSFTVNVTPATGYKFGNISYNSVDYNNGEEIKAVKDVTNIAVTVAVDTVNVGFTKLNNATINVSYTDDQATSATAEITADTTLAMQKGTEFTVTVNPITDYELKSIAYGTATSSENPATFTASANGAVTVTVEQTTPVVETVTVTVPFVENASVDVEYKNNKGAVTTKTITVANTDIVMKKDTDFTVTLNVNSGYKCDTITMTYASLSKSDNPATFTASTNGTLTITANISQTSTGEATIKFKSARSYMYKVSMSVNGAAATEMTRPDKASTSNDDNFGTSYTGTLTFCWYTQKITVTNGETTTLSFKTSGTKLNAKVSAKLEAGKTYYFAVDDIAPSSNTEVTAVELPSGNTKSDQMERNYFHSARHLIYNGTTEDSVLGFTNIDNKKYMIGQLLNNSNSANALSVVSATAVQKSVASVEEYSDLQNTLLDANMNGKLDVKDATLIQKAVVGLV